MRSMRFRVRCWCLCFGVQGFVMCPSIWLLDQGDVDCGADKGLQSPGEVVSRDEVVEMPKADTQT
jgi:hypothetical protein